MGPLGNCWALRVKRVVAQIAKSEQPTVPGRECQILLHAGQVPRSHEDQRGERSGWQPQHVSVVPRG